VLAFIGIWQWLVESIFRLIACCNLWHYRGPISPTNQNMRGYMSDSQTHEPVLSPELSRILAESFVEAG
jgi:hypothetical protein